MANVVRRTLRCTRAERAEIRERADALGMTVSGYLVACALHEDAGGPRRDEPRLVLSEEQQQTLYQRVEEMDRVRRALGESLPGPAASSLRTSRLRHKPRRPRTAQPGVRTQLSGATNRPNLSTQPYTAAPQRTMTTPRPQSDGNYIGESHSGGVGERYSEARYQSGVSPT